MNWRWITIAVLLATLVAGYNAFMRRDPSEVTSATAPLQPGYFLSNAIVTQTEQDGSPGIRLIAEHIDQQRENESITARTVQVELLKTVERQWLLTADTALVPSGSRVIEFKGNVRLRPLESSDNALLRTDALAIDTEREVAYSIESPVNIRYGGLAMRVKRFEADLKTEKIKLESVRGRSDRGA